MDDCWSLISSDSRLAFDLPFRVAVVIIFYPMHIFVDRFIWKPSSTYLKLCFLGIAMAAQIFHMGSDSRISWHSTYFLSLLVTLIPQTFVLQQRLLTSGGIHLFWSLGAYSHWVGLCTLLTGSGGSSSTISMETVAENDELVEIFFNMVIHLVYAYAISKLDVLWAYLKRTIPRRQLYFFLAVMQASAWIYVLGHPLQKYCHGWYVFAVRTLWELPLFYLSTAKLFASWYLHLFVVLLSALGREIHKFEYEPLNRSNSEIRLLKILPSRLGGPIHTELIDVPISEACRYEAISYRWDGEPSTIFPIYMNGQYEELSATVHTILSDLRDSRKERLVWIDSICINQRDDEEKSWQIGLMKQVYSDAEQVIGWLGYSPQVSGALHTIATVWTSGGLDEVVSIIAHGAYSVNWSNVLLLLSEDWFSRIWIIQEIALAKDINLRHGHEELPWNEFLNFLAIFYQQDFRESFGTSLGLSHFASGQFASSLVNIMRMVELRTLIQSHPNGLLLHELMEMTTGFNSSRPQDRVYGILGLTTDTVRQSIPVDYTIDSAVTLTRAARYVLFSEAAINCLRLAGTGDSTRQVSNSSRELPSWVPNWNEIPWRPSRLDLSEVADAVSFENYSCCSHLDPDIFDVQGSERLLGVSIAIIGTVDRLSSVWNLSAFMPQIPENVPNPRLAVLKRIEQAYSLFEEAMEMAEMATVRPDSYGYKELLWRTILTPSHWGFDADENALNQTLDDLELLFEFAERPSMNDQIE